MNEDQGASNMWSQKRYANMAPARASLSLRYQEICCLASACQQSCGNMSTSSTTHPRLHAIVPRSISCSLRVSFISSLITVNLTTHVIVVVTFMIRPTPFVVTLTVVAQDGGALLKAVSKQQQLDASLRDPLSDTFVAFQGGADQRQTHCGTKLRHFPLQDGQMVSILRSDILTTCQ